MDGPIRVLSYLMVELRIELNKTAKDLQEEFSIMSTGIKDHGSKESKYDEL